MHKDYATKYIGKTVTVRIDRPIGTMLPKWNLIYTVNYGEIPGTKAPDGEPIDAYVLGVFEPKDEFTGKCIAVIHRTDDDDDKLIVVPKEKNYTNEQMLALTEFIERFYKPTIVREKPTN